MITQSYPHVGGAYPQLCTSYPQFGEFKPIKKATARDQLLFLCSQMMDWLRVCLFFDK
jgi:hypothetical protein